MVNKNINLKNQLLVSSFNPSSFAVHFKYANNELKNSFFYLLTGKVNYGEFDITSMSPKLSDIYLKLLSFVTKNKLTMGIRSIICPLSTKMIPEKAKELKKTYKF